MGHQECDRLGHPSCANDAEKINYGPGILRIKQKDFGGNSDDDDDGGERNSSFC